MPGNASGEECVSTAGKLVPPKVFVDTPYNCALTYNETVPKDKRERIFRHVVFVFIDCQKQFVRK
jgi:hypothetical protein